MVTDTDAGFEIQPLLDVWVTEYIPLIAVVTFVLTTGLPVAVPPPGKVHLSVSVPSAVAVRVSVWPEHRGLGFAPTRVGAAIVSTTTATDAADDVHEPSACVTK